MKQLPKGAEYEIRTDRTKSTNVIFSGSKFDRIDSGDQTNIRARVMADGKMTAVSSSKPNAEDELLTKAMEMVEYGSPVDVPFVGAAEYKKLNLLDDRTMTSKEMIDVMQGLISDVQKIDSRLTISARLSSSVADISLKTSAGFSGSYSKSFWSWVCGIELVQGDDLLNIYEYDMKMGPEPDLEMIKETIKRKLEKSTNVVDFKPGAYPVIFTPSEVGNIFNPVVQSMNGQAIERGVSPWGDKIGQELLDKRITLIDDGSKDKAISSLPFDMEGTPTRENVIVRDGVIGDILTNRKVAAKLGKVSSGNHGQMGPVPHALILTPGTQSLDELVKSIDYGIIIDNTMGAWSGNPFAGIVSGTISLGLKVEKGQVVGRVKDSMFTVNAFEHLKSKLIGISKEQKQSSMMFGSLAQFPYVLLDEVVISAK